MGDLDTLRLLMVKGTVSCCLLLTGAPPVVWLKKVSRLMLILERLVVGVKWAEEISRERGLPAAFGWYRGVDIRYAMNEDGKIS